jgi:hypothetical protein
MPCGSRYPGIMGKIPSARDAIGLHELAALLRRSAAETGDQNYVGLFLTAAMALEARAAAAPSAYSERRHNVS